MLTQRMHTKEGSSATLDRSTRVLVVEDQRVLREALVLLLEDSDDVIVSGTASSAEEALRKIDNKLDLVILDISLPGRNGIWLTKEIKKIRPNLPVLVLTMHDQSEFVLRALESGVDGYLTKSAGQQEILKAIDSLAGKGSYLQARIAPLVVDALRCREQTRRRVRFSEREREIASCLVKGLSNPEIAEKIRLSVSTVKSDLRSLYSKLQVSTRTEAVAVVVQKGLTRKD